VPDEPAARCEDPREFSNDSRVIRGVSEKPERCKKIENDFESVLPSGRQPPHVPMGVAEIGTGSTIARDLQELPGVVHRIDVVASFGEQVGVSALATRNVENARPHRQSQQLYESSDFRARPFGCEKRAVLQQVVGVEGRFPPLEPLLQKNTGSRYAPKTDSIAARIS